MQGLHDDLSKLRKQRERLTVMLRNQIGTALSL